MDRNMRTLILLGLIILNTPLLARTYFVSSKIGKDTNNGITKETPFKTLGKVSGIKLQPGDNILLASGQIFYGTLELRNISGLKEKPILISKYNGESDLVLPIIDSKGMTNGILLENCSHVIVTDIEITGNGGKKPKNAKMNCGILITVSESSAYENIQLKNLVIRDLFFEEKGFQRGKDEVRTANGTQSYGWGIRCINPLSDAIIKDVLIENCTVKNVAHTGIKFTGKGKNIHNVKLYDNTVFETGGPGMQMSGVHQGHVKNNNINGSGSDNDSRKWGRGSGLWTWGSSDILIEKNSFRNANGPGDSAGCHIDFNCNNVVVQYCVSENNAGGFCEILGNNYNCAYRYNISINDGHREKKKGVAFQEGKIFWLSGFCGKDKKRNGPFNSYFYNNTIFVKSNIEAKFAVDRASKGALIVNNIFYIEGKSKMVLGDQYKPEVEGESLIENIVFRNNLFLRAENWPKDIQIQDEKPLIGDPRFKNKNGIHAKDFVPQNKSLVKDKGIIISKIPGDKVGLFIGLEMEQDILGNKINGLPDMGAIELN